MTDDPPDTLTELIETAAAAGEEPDSISIDDVLNAVGQRAFGHFLLIPGLIVLSPISGIPGVPTVGAIMILLVAGQMLLGRECFWVPAFIRKREISRKRVEQAARFMKPVSRVVDKLIWRRLSFLTQKPFTYAIALSCAAIALIMPPLEVILFANVLTSAAISAFALALVANDGLLASIAFLFTGAAFYIAFSIFM
jgi:hypothetical protein